MKLKLILTTAIVGTALALPSVSSAAPASATQPTLSIERNCEAIPGANTVDVILSGFPPFTPFEATLEFDGSGVGPIQLTTDANGSFDSSTVGFIGSFEPATFTATIIWAGGTLRESLFVDCSTPVSKEECKRGGWRNFPQFKNQGQCIAFVNHNS
jgi:hypothetical protein